MAVGRARSRALALILRMAMAVLVWCGPVAADTNAARLMEVLRIDEMIDIMRDEGMTYADELDADMLGGEGGAFFRTSVQEIYDGDVMAQLVRRTMGQIMDQQAMDGAIAFYETERGQRILSLETAARRAMADPVVEEIARDTYRVARADPDPRLEAITHFVQRNDLIERNVAGALSSNFHFYRGFVDGGGMVMDEATILADVWRQEDAVRTDTESWLFGFLMMAYRPLSDGDLEAYIDFAETPAGQSLNTALFAGFDEVYRMISFALGRTVAQAMSASDL